MNIEPGKYYRNGYGDVDYINHSYVKDEKTRFYGDFVYTETGHFLGREFDEDAALKDEVKMYYFQVDYESGTEFTMGVFAKDEAEAAEELKKNLLNQPIKRITTTL